LLFFCFWDLVFCFVCVANLVWFSLCSRLLSLCISRKKSLLPCGVRSFLEVLSLSFLFCLHRYLLFFKWFRRWDARECCFYCLWSIHKLLCCLLLGFFVRLRKLRAHLDSCKLCRYRSWGRVFWDFDIFGLRFCDFLCRGVWFLFGSGACSWGDISSKILFILL